MLKKLFRNASKSRVYLNKSIRKCKEGWFEVVTNVLRGKRILRNIVDFTCLIRPLRLESHTSRAWETTQLIPKSGIDNGLYNRNTSTGIDFPGVPRRSLHAASKMCSRVPLPWSRPPRIEPLEWARKRTSRHPRASFAWAHEFASRFHEIWPAKPRGHVRQGRATIFKSGCPRDASLERGYRGFGD